MGATFVASVSDWATKSNARMKGIIQESAHSLIEQAQTVGPSVANPSGGAGGRMPVDTNFLRASMAVSFDGMPVGPSKGDPKTAYQYDEAAVTLMIARYELGQTIYAGWTAAYSVFPEEKYGFCRGAAQNWQSIVSQVVQEAKANYP